MKTKMTEEQVTSALIDPANVFSNPMAVVAEDSLSTECKIEILRRWEYDAREMQVADEEGFPGREPGSLFDAVLAERCIGSAPDPTLSIHRQPNKAACKEWTTKIGETQYLKKALKSPSPNRRMRRGIFIVQSHP